MILCQFVVESLAKGSYFNTRWDNDKSVMVNPVNWMNPVKYPEGFDGV